MADTRGIERRFVPSGRTEVRAAKADDGTRSVAGVAAVYASVTDIGPFSEEIEAGAFDEALKRSDIRGLFNHDPNLVLGRTKSGTMKVTSTATGLEYDIPSLPAARADVAEAVERGDVDGSSFSFIVREGGDEWTVRDGKPHRIIKRDGVLEVFDLGPVTFPAYEDTQVSSRSLERAQAEAAKVAPAAPPLSWYEERTARRAHAMGIDAGAAAE